MEILGKHDEISIPAKETLPFYIRKGKKEQNETQKHDT